MSESDGSSDCGSPPHVESDDEDEFGGARLPSMTFTVQQVIGRGSCGVVFSAFVAETKEIVAVKRLVSTEEAISRELHFLRRLKHPNVVRLRRAFFSKSRESRKKLLNLVMEYVPESGDTVIRHYRAMKTSMPAVLLRVYIYQTLRALAYLQLCRVCHRDIKPPNLLICGKTHTLKICDFGSAKQLTLTHAHASYVGARFYRAPELIFGAVDYSFSIDIWSLGCVMAEMMLLHPIFPGDSGITQLVEMMKILGTPTLNELHCMNCTSPTLKLPTTHPVPFESLFPLAYRPEGPGLCLEMLKYIPEKRVTTLQAMQHPFFDPLREPWAQISACRPLPNLFDATREEQMACPAELLHVLFPTERERTMHL
mmetsp:Transcript_35708/g.85943  ORF Transcript_35708/g.85943 Transcript_35708/m.85943 type:complete len:368 (+) Transcript_35708:38-1141(+)